MRDGGPATEKTPINIMIPTQPYRRRKKKGGKVRAPGGPSEKGRRIGEIVEGQGKVLDGGG